jgi:antitoxin YefM
MAIQTTYTNVRTNLAKLWDEVVLNQEIVIISKSGSEDVALISASELSSLVETAHLLRSSKNAERLFTALERAKTKTVAPQTIEELRQEVGLVQEET